VEAANLDQAIRGLEQQPVDIVVAALGSSAQGQFRFAGDDAPPAGVGGHPMLALADTAEQMRARAANSVDFQDCPGEVRREAMLESVARLARAWLPSSRRRPAREEK